MHYQHSTSKYHFPLITIVLVTCLLLIFGLSGCASDSTSSSSSNESASGNADPVVLEIYAANSLEKAMDEV